MANPNLGQGPQINGIDGEGICLGKIRVALMEGGSPPHLTVSFTLPGPGAARGQLLDPKHQEGGGIQETRVATREESGDLVFSAHKTLQ